MNRSGDDGREMPHGPSFDDGAIDAILGGDSPGDDLAAVTSFVGDVRSAAGAVPTPSPALAAALASGISPTDAAPEPKWRKLKMKIQGFLAGLGIAGKLALGAGVAAAATTGAGAAGVLPGPVQHAFAKAVHVVTPFEVPDGDGSGSNEAAPPLGGDTTTTVASTPGTEHHDGGDGTDADPGGNGDGDGSGVVVTPTTEHRDGDGPGVTTPGQGNGDGGDGGEHDGDSPPPAETPTTEHHGGNGDGDHNNPESLTINCVRGTEPNRIHCEWSASTSADHHRYLLLRIGDGQSRVVFSTEDGQSYTDTSVQPGVTYGYRVISVRTDDSVESHSPMAYVQCCGDTPPTTAPHGDGGGDGVGGDH
jgi:hypothetical protein